MALAFAAGFLAVTWPLLRMLWHALHHDGDLAWLARR